MGIDVGIRRNLRAEDNLGQTVAIAQINKNKASVVPSVLNPAHEAYTLSDVAAGESAATVAAAPVSHISNKLLVLALYICGLKLIAE
jgi:hypothetical protein